MKTNFVRHLRNYRPGRYRTVAIPLWLQLQQWIDATIVGGVPAISTIFSPLSSSDLGAIGSRRSNALDITPLSPLILPLLPSALNSLFGRRVEGKGEQQFFGEGRLVKTNFVRPPALSTADVSTINDVWRSKIQLVQNHRNTESYGPKPFRTTIIIHYIHDFWCAWQ